MSPKPLALYPCLLCKESSVELGNHMSVSHLGPYLSKKACSSGIIHSLLFQCQTLNKLSIGFFPRNNPKYTLKGGKRDVKGVILHRTYQANQLFRRTYDSIPLCTTSSPICHPLCVSRIHKVSSHDTNGGRLYSYTKPIKVGHLLLHSNHT